MDKYEDSIKIIARGAGIAFIGVIISKILSYLFRLIAARFGVDNYGYLSLGIAITIFAVILCSLGFEKGVLRYVSYFLEKKKKDKAKGVIISTISISLIFSLIITTILFIFANQIQQILFPNINDQNFIIVMKIILLTIPLHVVLKILISVFKAFKKAEYEVYAKNITESGVKIVFTLLFFILGFGIISIAFSYTLSIFLSLILALYLFRKNILQYFKKTRAKFITKELIKYSLPLMFMGVFLTVMMSFDTFMLGFFKDAHTVGIYNAVIPTAQLMFIFPFAILNLYLPIITGLYAKNIKIGKIYKIVSKWILIFTAFVFMLFLVYPKELLILLFGKEFSTGALALIIIGLGYLFYFALYASEHILLVYKKTNIISVNYFLIAIMNIILNYLLIPKFGLNGAAISTSLSYIVLACMLFIESYLLTKYISFGKVSLKILLSGGLLALLFFEIKKLLPINNLLMLLSSIIILGLAYVLTLLLLKTVEAGDLTAISYFEEKLGLKSKPVTCFLKKFIRTKNNLDSEDE